MEESKVTYAVQIERHDKKKKNIIRQVCPVCGREKRASDKPLYIQLKFDDANIIGFWALGLNFLLGSNIHYILGCYPSLQKNISVNE